MIRAVLFDYGGVITRGGPERGVPQRLGRELGVPVEEAEQLLHGIWHELAQGRISPAKFWHEISRRSGRVITPGAQEIFSEWEYMRPDPRMADFVAELRAAGVRVGLVSNVIKPTADMLRAHGVYDLFEFCVLSYQVGFTKPQPQIYQQALEYLPGIRPQEIIFVDDQQRCLEPARTLGTHTVLARTTATIITDIRRVMANEETPR